MLYLKQSTAATIQIGPFLDAADAVTAETGLTLSQADVRLSKNGADWAQKNESTACTHDEAGWYTCPLDATDTNTLGRLQLAVAESGALPVWHEFTVLAANVYDALIGGSDYLQVDALQIEGSDATGQIAASAPTAAAIADQVWDESSTGHTDAGKAGAQVWTDVDAILEDTAEVGAAGAGLTAVPWNAAWDAEVQSEAADALTAYDPPTAAEIPTAAAIADQVWDESSTGHTDAGKAGAQVWTDVDAILEDTAAISTPPTAAAVADQVWDELIAAHAGAGSAGAALTAASAAAGAGAVEWTFTLHDGAGDPLPEADVWVTSDSDGDAVLASGETNSSGQVTFYLDPGTVYAWCQKAGCNFTNPTTVTIA